MKKLLSLLVAALAVGSIRAEDLLAGLTRAQLKKEVGNIDLVITNDRPNIIISGQTGVKKGSGNLYVNSSIMLPEPVSLEGRSLKITAVSANPPKGLYVRAYNRGEAAPAWSFLSWDGVLKTEPKEIILTAGCDDLLKWESAKASGQPARQIDRLQFYLGTAIGNTSIDMTISDIQIVSAVPGKKKAVDLDQVVTLPSKSVLVDGQSVNLIILHPDSAAGRTAASRIVEAIKKITGVTVPSRAGAADDWNPSTHAIMLGNIYNNPALRVLYARNMTTVDELMPGAGGYTVESVIEPFHTGADIIVLGASDEEGLTLAADAFISKTGKFWNNGKLEVPILFDTHYTAAVTLPEFKADHVKEGIAEARDRLAKGIHTSLGGQLASIAKRYRLTRNSLDARLFVEVARIYQADAIADPKKFGGAWGFDSDFVSYDAIAGWDMIEHDPALSSDDRLLVSNMILHWLNEAIAREASAGGAAVGPVSNHLTFASLGTMMGGFYYYKYYPAAVAQSEDWLNIARAVFRNQIRYAKVHDDCNGYQWLTWRHIMLYSLALPDNQIVENGVGDKMVLGCGITMDNLGAQAPYGDDSGWASSGGELTVLNLYYALSRSNLAALMIEMKRPRSKIEPGTFYAKLAPRQETVLNGVKIFALDKGFYDHNEMEGVVPPLDKTFDKFCFRAALNPEALYLLVDGVNIGGHRHADANSVLRYSQFGREWLAENDYKLNQQKYHNSLLMLFNGEAFTLPGLMEVVNQGENEDFGYVTVRASQWGPSDWIRYYVWLKKNQAWLVIDELNARKTGTYRLVQRWNGIGAVTPKSDGYLLEQPGASVRFQTTPDAALSTYDDTDLAKGWIANPYANTNLAWIKYPYAGKAIHVMNQTVEAELKADSRIQMIAVWHGNSQPEVAPWAVDRVANGFTVNTGSELYTITADKPGEVKLARKEMSAALAERKSAAGGSQKSSVPAMQEVWRIQQNSSETPALPEELTKVIRVRDGSGDYLAVGAASGVLSIYSLEGGKQSQVKFPARINDIAALDVDDDGEMELLLAGRDAWLRAVKRDGREIWKVQFEQYREYPDVTIVRTADINNDGKEEILAGCDNWRTYAFDRHGKELWRYEVVHSTRAVETADIDGDGKVEILCGTRYMKATVLSNTGTKQWGGSFGAGCRAIAAPLSGQGRQRNVVLGFNTGTITFHDFKGKELNSFITGDEIFMMAVAGAENGREDVLVSSYNGYVYRFSADGKLIWSVAMPDSVVVLKTLNDGRAAVGTIGGDVCVVSSDGKIGKSARLAGRIADILVDGSQLRAVTQKGDIATLTP